jgi:peptide deformylase
MEVLTTGDPRLRKRAETQTDYSSPELNSDINTLEAALEEHGGMGIAAPQLGINRRLLLIHSRPNERYPNAPESELQILINPEIISHSHEKELDWEGCLSVPNQRAKVWRYSEITVDYKELDGRSIRAHFSGFTARIFQHEFDHLNGEIFIDHVKPEDIVSEAEYLRLIQ